MQNTVEIFFTFTGALSSRWCKIFNIIALYNAKSYKWYSLRFDFWLIRPHRTKMRLLLPMYTWSVGLSVTIVSRAKTAEPIEMPFGLWISVGLRNHVLDGCPDPNAKGQFWRETLDIEKFRHGTSTLACVVSLVRPTTVASLSHRASTFVYNTVSVTQRVAQVRLRQLRVFAPFCSYCRTLGIERVQACTR